MEKQEKQIVEIDILSLLRALWLKRFTIVLGRYALFFAALATASLLLLVWAPHFQPSERNTGSFDCQQDLQAGSYRAGF